MNSDNRQSIIGSHGVKWGVIIGVLYCMFLFLRYHLGEYNPLLFSGIALMGFIVVLVLLLVCGFQLRKKLGGYIELKEAFKALFYAVLIFELFYAVFNFVYLKYVNPDFFYNFKESTEKVMVEAGQSRAQIDKTLSAIDVDAPQRMNIFDSLKSYFFSVALTGAIAFLMSLIIRKKPDLTRDVQDNFLQG